MNTYLTDRCKDLRFLNLKLEKIKYLENFYKTTLKTHFNFNLLKPKLS